MHHTHHDTTYAHGTFTLTKLNSVTGEVISTTPVHHNLVLNSAFNLIAQQNVTGSTNLLKITTLEIGTGDTAPAGTDTALETVTLTDIPRANQSATGPEAYISFFISTLDLPNGEYKELGLRAGATLYTRALISPTFTKSTNEDVRVDYTITYSAVV